jgi:hypothetical protein
MKIRKGQILLFLISINVALCGRTPKSMLSPDSPFYKYLDDNSTSLFSMDNLKLFSQQMKSNDILVQAFGTSQKL